MPAPQPKILLIVDDREFVQNEVRSIVGARRFGDIIYKRCALIEHLRSALPEWARTRLFHIRTADELAKLRNAIEQSSEDTAGFVIAGRAGFTEPERLKQLIERLPYAEDDFTDRFYKPLVVFMRNAHRLMDDWSAFESAPLHFRETAWHGFQRLQSTIPLDLANIRDFLTFTSCSTATRHFNAVEVDAYYYTKSSRDKRKMLAEYSFYALVPESMRPWLIQPFDYRDDGSRASYKMMRYYLADASLQWVHGAFDSDSFRAFVERLLFFVRERPRKACSKARSSEVAHGLFVAKLEERAKQFLSMAEGQRINTLVSSSKQDLDLNRQLARYHALYQRYADHFAFDHMVVGHGDPCFSNILYDQQRYLLKLIDPKGAVTEDELWTHPLYDLCKISHSVLGDYDFVNNGLYSVGFTENNQLELRVSHSNHASLQPIFLECMNTLGYSRKIIRLGEASLFLSMLPLHIDHPNKVMAFLLKAHSILNEVERD
ncbi:hypothetical protein [Cupriavidus necator]